MRKDTTGATQAHGDEHELVDQLRQAMADKDIVTMGQMLELLGTIKAELVMGKPVVDGLGRTKTDPGAGSAAGKGRTPGPPAPAVRVARQ